jgi:hypothetical protein
MDSWETKACLDVGHSQKVGSRQMADSRVVDVNVQLNFDVAKSYGSLTRYRGDLVHHKVHGINIVDPSQAIRSGFPGLITTVWVVMWQ